MNVGTQPGELGRFRVLGGPDSGVVFVVLAPTTTIGRGEENDLVLLDLNTSRKHAELSVGPLPGGFTVRDLGSQNGILVNGIPQKNAQLKSGDKLGMGRSVLEYVASDQKFGAKLPAPPIPNRLPQQIGTGSSGLTQFIRKPQQQAKSPQSSGFIQKNRTLVLLLGGLFTVAALLPEVEQRQKTKKKGYADPNEVQFDRLPSSLPPPEVLEKANKSADIFYREGFREFRAQNYSRAIVAFETALQIYSDHALARVYLEKTKKTMETEAKEIFKNARRDEESNRLPAAMAKYESVKRLYSRDQSNRIYKEAEKYETDLKAKMKDSGLLDK
ncbi:MAG: FHA domain-containing protein [Bacteriovoracia bacterium]